MDGTNNNEEFGQLFALANGFMQMVGGAEGLKPMLYKLPKAIEELAANLLEKVDLKDQNAGFMFVRVHTKNGVGAGFMPIKILQRNGEKFLIEELKEHRKSTGELLDLALGEIEKNKPQ